MSDEGSAIPMVRRWLLEVLKADTNLTGVPINYGAPVRPEEVRNENGNFESIFWGDASGEFELIGYRATANVRYREDTATNIIITVAGKDRDDNQQVVDARAAELLGRVMFALASEQPTPADAVKRVVVRPGPVAVVTGGLKIRNAEFGYACRFDLSVLIDADVHMES